MTRYAVPLVAFLSICNDGFAQDNHSVEGQFIGEVMRCAAQLNVEIGGNIEGSLSSIISGDGADGSAYVFLHPFLELFPSEDRLDAYRIYTECLTTSYQTIDSGSGLVVASPDDYVDFTNKTVMIREFLDVNDPQRQSEEFRFSVARNCQLMIEFYSGMGFSHHYRLDTPFGSRIRGSLIGTNHGPHRVQLSPGDYVFRLVANRGAGQYRVDLQTICE